MQVARDHHPLACSFRLACYSRGVGHVLAVLFYGVMLGAVGFFVHKVLWFVRYRSLQDRMLGRALEKLTEQADTTVVRWDRGAEHSWSEANASHDAGPTDYVRRVEEDLARIERVLEDGHTPVRSTFVRAVVEDTPAETFTVLRIPRHHGDALPVEILLSFGHVPEPNVPDPALFELNIRSRYGFWRRLLAFFLGAADVVYSSQHVIRMSQNQSVPANLLIRRVSLVLLILVALGLDIGFGIRDHLIAWAERWTRTHLSLDGTLGEYAPSVIGLGLWLTIYGALYLGLYIGLRWWSGRKVARLETLRNTYKDRIADIRDMHLEGLQRWARDYATTLDDAAMLTLHQALMLVQRTRHRLRRRVASKMLLALAEEVAQCFFARLPESATELRDVATQREHSLAHKIWPRAREMAYQVEIAKFRHAWRDIELCLSALRGQHPDPDLAGQLWRSLVRYARMFPEVVPEDLFTRLQEAHGNTVENMVDATDADLADLDQRLTELATALSHTFESVSALVESRIELTTQAMNAAVADLVAEALRVREEARLEAMAFEI